MKLFTLDNRLILRKAGSLSNGKDSYWPPIFRNCCRVSTEKHDSKETAYGASRMDAARPLPNGWCVEIASPASVLQERRERSRGFGGRLRGRQLAFDEFAALHDHMQIRPILQYRDVSGRIAINYQ
jgi:hypothetical protein